MFYEELREISESRAFDRRTRKSERESYNLGLQIMYALWAL